MTRSVFFLFFILTAGFACSASQGAPDFPLSARGAIQPVTESQAQEQAALPKESVTPESARTNRTPDVKLAEIHVTILYGHSQNGEKSSKVSYRVIENQTQDKEPVVKVTYKNREDKKKYAVSEVSVRKNKNGTYEITPTIVEKENNKELEPEVIYLE